MDTEKFAPYKIVTGNQRLLSSSGLAIIGQILKHTGLRKALNAINKTKSALHMNFECVAVYLALLCQGKTAYENMREMREDPQYYCCALRLKGLPSVETLRQRLDEIGFDLAATDILMEESAHLLKKSGLKPSPCFTGHVPIDADVSPHDNSKTKKEGVARTYKGIDGYAPMYAYVGMEGYIANVELREGDSHSQAQGTVEFFDDTLRFARIITAKPLLVRLDSGNDALDNIKLFIDRDVDFIIKRNLRGESESSWLAIAKEHGTASHPRDGKTIYTGSIMRDRGIGQPLRIVFRVTERSIHANGQVFLEPKINIDTWWASIDNPEEDIIRLYREHATCEQFHSEIKSDIGLERFPSGKFDTNAGILKIAALAYNILRIIGQTALDGGQILTRDGVRRIRAKTVMQNLIYIAGHVVSHARQKFLNLGRSNIWRNAFKFVYESFA
jgi:hypothetical protein